MQAFSTSTQIDIKTYRSILLKGIYKKPLFIVTTLLGLYFFITIFLDTFKIIPFYSRAPIPALVCGLFFFCLPWIITFISVKQFKANPNFQKKVTYTFSDSGIEVKGETFSNKVSWREIIDFKELKPFVILYHKKKFGYVISEEGLTAEQIKFIKNQAYKG